MQSLALKPADLPLNGNVQPSLVVQVRQEVLGVVACFEHPQHQRPCSPQTNTGKWPNRKAVGWIPAIVNGWPPPCTCTGRQRPIAGFALGTITRSSAAMAGCTGCMITTLICRLTLTAATATALRSPVPAWAVCPIPEHSPQRIPNSTASAPKPLPLPAAGAGAQIRSRWSW